MKKELLLDFINEPKNSLINFRLGKEYEDLGQYSSALSYYLRAAEFSGETLLAYESMLQIAILLDKQGNRYNSANSAAMRALSLYPKRPEAFFLISKLYEKTGDWQQSYAFACMGELLPDDLELEPFVNKFDYPGKYVFTFQRAVAGWWIGLTEESIALFRKLSKDQNINHQYLTLINNNLNNISLIYKTPIKYNKEYYPELRFKFKNSEYIKRNYSQVYQDMFVLSMLDGKENGRFIELGCYDPYENNNTALLEENYKWTGISIDKNEKIYKKFKNYRKSEIIIADALELDFNKLLTYPTYDYLQIDCEPAIVSFNILQKIPFNKHKFAVITFEHDYYTDKRPDVRDKSRNYLKSLGYELIVNNISEDRYSSFEDWWVHPDLVDKKIINIMKCISDDVKRADLYMLNKLN